MLYRILFVILQKNESRALQVWKGEEECIRRNTASKTKCDTWKEKFSDN